MPLCVVTGGPIFSGENAHQRMFDWLEQSRTADERIQRKIEGASRLENAAANTPSSIETHGLAAAERIQTCLSGTQGTQTDLI